MATTRIGIIDDGYPVMDEKRLSLERIEHLTIHEKDWGQEESLRELSILLSGESLKWKRRIQFEAFNHPQTFKEEQGGNPDFLIYDWEYKPVAATTDDFYDILTITNSKVFIYSAYDKIDDIKTLLQEEKFQELQQTNRFEIKSKGSDDEAESILKVIMEKFSYGEDVTWEDIAINIKPSRYVIDSADFWKIKSIVGVDSLIKHVTHETKIFDEKSIEKLFSDYNDFYYIDSKKNILSSFESDFLKAGFGKLQKISAIDALQAFGIDKLEEAKEKGYTEIK